MAIPDTSIAYFLKPVVQVVTDTMFLAGPPNQDSRWFKYIGPAVAIVIGIGGWLANSYYTRKNQLKGFEESVLDRIRIELNVYFIEYEKWLDSIYEIFETLFNREVDRQLGVQKYQIDRAAHLENIEHLKNEVNKNPSPENRNKLQLYNRDEGLPDPVFWLDISELVFFIKKSSKPKIFNRFAEYDLLLFNFIPVMEHINRLHRNFFTGCKLLGSRYGSEPSKPDDAKPELNKLFIELITIRALRYQLFQFLQYECLKSMSRIQIPNFEDSEMEHIVRDPVSGMLKIVKAKTDLLDFEMLDQDSNNSSKSE